MQERDAIMLCFVTKRTRKFHHSISFFLFSYPSPWLSGWLSCRVFFLLNSHYFVQNQLIIYMLVIFPTVRWIQMTPSTVCFGARDDSYGFFRTAKAGNIITFKLTHKSGYVTCHSSNPSYQSKWGCLWNHLIPNQMAVMAIMGTRKRVLQCMVCMFE